MKVDAARDLTSSTLYYNKLTPAFELLYIDVESIIVEAARNGAYSACISSACIKSRLNLNTLKEVLEDDGYTVSNINPINMSLLVSWQ